MFVLVGGAEAAGSDSDAAQDSQYAIETAFVHRHARVEGEAAFEERGRGHYWREDQERQQYLRRLRRRPSAGSNIVQTNNGTASQ